MSNLNLNTISSLDTGREVDVSRVMQTVDYVGGLVIDSLDTVIVDGDDRYVLTASTALPYTTTGAGMPEGGAFVSVCDAVLRQDLASPDKGAAMVAGSALSVGSVDSLDEILGVAEAGRGALVSGAPFYYDGSAWRPATSVNVLAFGGAPGGDITEAIRAAVTYLGERGGGVVTIPSGEYTISDSISVKYDNIHITGQGEVVLNANGSSECSILFGTQMSSRDTRPDNLPMYPASDVFDPAHFSPAAEDYPRYKNVGLHNLNIVRHVDGLGVGFYRIDGVTCKDVSISFADITLSGANVIRTFYCVGGEFDNVAIGASECTFGFFTFWSYGIHFNRVATQANRNQTFEFKGVMECTLKNSRIRNDKAALALIVGYGSRGVTIENCEIVCPTGNGVVLSSQEEFDYARRIHLLNCSIEAEAVGLRISRLYKSRIENCSIKAARAVSFYCDAFATGTSLLEGFTPSQNTAPFTYDGNYDVVRDEGPYLRYLENRPYPAFLDSSMKDCTLSGEQTIVGRVSVSEDGAYPAGTLGSNRLKRFSSVRELPGSREAGRVTVPYTQYMVNTAPFSLQDARLEGLTLSGASARPELEFSIALRRTNFTDVTTLGAKAVFLFAAYVEDCNFTNVKMGALAGSAVQPLVRMDRVDNVVFTGCVLSGGGTLLELGNNVNTLDPVRRVMFDGCEFRYTSTVPTGRILTLRFGSDVDSVYVGTPVEFRGCNLQSLTGATIASAWQQSHQGVAPSWDSPASRQYGMIVRECSSNGASRALMFQNATGPTPANRPNFLGEIAINTAPGEYVGRASFAVSGFRSPSDPVIWAALG